MKILKDNTVKKVVCIHCQSKLEVCYRDTFRDYYDYYGIPMIDTYYYCPCCGEKNIIA